MPESQPLPSLEQVDEKVARELRELRSQLARVERKLDGLVRGAWLDLEAIPYPERLTAQRFPIYSQNDEDGITWAVLREAGIESHTFVELGCGDNGGNSGFLARELGFRGLMVDGSRRNVRVATNHFASHKVAVVNEWITAENVNGLLDRQGLDELDFLSIDVDGNDLWLWRAIDREPRVAVLEFNPSWGAERAVAVPYDAKFARQRQEPREELKDRYYGASLRALVHVARERGYRLVAVEPAGVNAYFIRDGLATRVPELPADQAFRRHRKAELLKARGLDLFEVVQKHGLPLTEFSS